MAISPPPVTTGGSPIPSRSYSSSVPDSILSIVFPFCLVCAAIFFACFFIGASNVKQFGAFGLCGLAAFCLYRVASKQGGTIIKWKFGLTEWAILLLIAHNLYFSIAIDWITK